MQTESEHLFEEIKKYDFYPESMTRIAGEINNVAFFPGGRGTFDNSEYISDKPIMIVGQDFDSFKNFERSRNAGGENIDKNPTWKNIRELLKNCEINPSDCFFTNAILGARNQIRNTGKSPAFSDEKFLAYCKDFFLEVLEIQKPKLILVLGMQVARFFSTFESLSSWAEIKTFNQADERHLSVQKQVILSPNFETTLVLLVHPSFRKLTVKYRRFRHYIAEDAEIEMIKFAME
ncbi:MAG: hypothetical protein NT004_11095 [Bacteroidetes bacterium]|nr:hypothetical protein [Bacteroidota bacterium]